MTEQDKQALIKHFCSRDCGEAAEGCTIMPCHEIELIQEFPTTEPDTDTISRQQAIDALRAMQTYKLFAGDDMLLIDQAGAQTELMMLPPAQPERIKGHWIAMEKKNLFRCSECDAVIYSESERDRNEFHKFCGRCGADMREVTT